MKTDWFSRVGPWLAWSSLAFIVIAMGAGLLLQVLVGSPLGGVPFLIHFSEAVGLTGFAVVGALIVWRHPRHPIGWIWLLIAFSFGIDHLAWGYGAFVVGSNPAPLLGAQTDSTWMYWNGRGTIGLLGLALLLLTFPSGKLLSPAWRIVAWIAVGRVILDIVMPILEFDPYGLRSFLTGLTGVRLPDSTDFALPKAVVSLVACCASWQPQPPW